MCNLLACETLQECQKACIHQKARTQRKECNTKRLIHADEETNHKLLKSHPERDAHTYRI